MPPHFFAMVKAELRMTFWRPTGRAVLAVGFAVGVLAVAVMAIIQAKVGTPDASTNGLARQLLTFSATDVAGWALRARNFFVLPMVLLLATGGTLAGEIADHTLRELLVRPVPRWSVLLAKYAALLALAAVSLILSLIPAYAGGLAVFRTNGAVAEVLAGYLASLLSDAGLIALGLLAGTIVRGAGAVVVAVIGLLMADGAARLVLFGLQQGGVAGMDQIRAMFPGSALEAWEGWSSATGWAWQPFAGLTLLIAVCLGGALFRLSRMDVP